MYLLLPSHSLEILQLLIKTNGGRSQSDSAYGINSRADSNSGVDSNFVAYSGADFEADSGADSDSGIRIDSGIKFRIASGIRISSGIEFRCFRSNISLGISISMDRLRAKHRTQTPTLMEMPKSTPIPDADSRNLHLFPSLDIQQLGISKWKRGFVSSSCV